MLHFHTDQSISVHDHAAACSISPLMVRSRYFQDRSVPRKTRKAVSPGCYTNTYDSRYGNPKSLTTDLTLGYQCLPVIES